MRMKTKLGAASDNNVQKVFVHLCKISIVKTPPIGSNEWQQWQNIHKASVHYLMARTWFLVLFFFFFLVIQYLQDTTNNESWEIWTWISWKNQEVPTYFIYIGPVQVARPSWCRMKLSMESCTMWIIYLIDREAFPVVSFSWARFNRSV